MANPFAIAFAGGVNLVIHLFVIADLHSAQVVHPFLILLALRDNNMSGKYGTWYCSLRILGNSIPWYCSYS